MLFQEWTGKGGGGRDLEIYTSKCFVPIYYATREYAIPTMDWEMGERSLNFHIKIFSAYTY
jgi:hypothetical protein